MNSLDHRTLRQLDELVTRTIRRRSPTRALGYAASTSLRYRWFMAERPTGAVTFLFTDIEGSTVAWEERPAQTARDLEVHDRVLRAAIESNGGFVFATGGDSFSAAFTSPSSALTAAVDAQRRLVEAGCGLAVRMGVHSGEAIERDGNYFGPALNRTARLMSIGHGGQVLVSLTTRELVTGARFTFTDLGEHRLADLAAPVRVAQLVADGLGNSFPPLRSAVATDNLPLIGDVYGREADIDRVTSLLGDARLVTLAGAGGIGKTTLAVAVAHRSLDLFPDGCWLVDLTDLQPGATHTEIAGTLASVDSRFASIDALAARRMLIVLDNCEHVLAGAGAYTTELLRAAPAVTVLTTSREPLGVRGEQVVPVEPLSVGESSAHGGAVDLFVTRAAEAGVTLDLGVERETITAICEAVDGLPLAIELAAARTAVMSPSQLLDRLSDRLAILQGGRDGPEHHHTIEATIAWSYDLLDDAAQRLLRHLSVFEGGFDLEHAEALGSMNGGPAVMNTLGDLIRKSLIQRRGERLAMLEAVRQFAAARLHDLGEDQQARQHHFDLFAAWADEVYHRDPVIHLNQQERNWVTDNLPNLLTATRWGAESGRETQAAQIAEILWHHHVVVRSGTPIVNDWYESLLPHADKLPSQLRMGVLHGSGTIASFHGDLDRAEHLLMLEYDLHRATGLFTRTGANAQNNLGVIASDRGDHAAAIRWYQAGIEAAKEARLPHHLVSGNVARTLIDAYGEIEGALEAIEAVRPLDHLALPWELIASRLLEAESRIRLGETDTPRQLVVDSLTTLREMGIRPDMQSWALSQLSELAFSAGDPEAAAALLIEAIELDEAEGQRPMWTFRYAIHLARLLLDRGTTDVARRVINAYQSQPDVIPPTHARALEEVVIRLEPEATPPTPTPHPQQARPLIDAIRDALTG